jgi:hypothetical protein
MTNPVGRPRIDIDLGQLEQLCQLNCTIDEIAAVFDCTRKTIERRMSEDEQFAQIIDKGRSMGKISVRREQFRIMQGGNASMAIWLGKQLLGQRDERDFAASTVPITIEVVNPLDED